MSDCNFDQEKLQKAALLFGYWYPSTMLSTKTEKEFMAPNVRLSWPTMAGQMNPLKRSREMRFGLDYPMICTNEEFRNSSLSFELKLSQ